jgi:hypothetical protein
VGEFYATGYATLMSAQAHGGDHKSKNQGKRKKVPNLKRDAAYYTSVIAPARAWAELSLPCGWRC